MSTLNPAIARVTELHDPGAYLDQPPQDGPLPDDARVVAGVGGGRHRGDQGVQVRRAADPAHHGARVADDDGGLERLKRELVRIALDAQGGTSEKFAKKLLKLTLSLGGDTTKTVFAGIKEAYAPETLVGRLVICVANLAPRKMKFGLSEGMVTACGPGGTEVFLLSPDSGAVPGQRVH